MERTKHADDFGTASPGNSSDMSNHAEEERLMQGNVQLGGKVPPPMSMESIKARVPSTIPCHSINGTFKGTFHLHEYLSSTSTSSCYSRLKACVSQEGASGRMTPREAEMRAGKGSRKSWKLTLMTMHAGQEMSLQKYFTLLGVERPGQEGLPRVDTAAPAAAEPQDNAACKTPWASVGRDSLAEEPSSKRQHVQGHEMPRRTTDESGTGMWQTHSPASLVTLSRTSAQDVLLSTRPSVHSAPNARSLELPDTLASRPSLQLTALTYPVPVSRSTQAMAANPSLLASLAAASNMQRTSAASASAADMESLLLKMEASRRLSVGASAFSTSHAQQQLSSSSCPQDWSQSARLGTAGLLHNQARQMLAPPTYLTNGSGIHQLLPVGSQPLTTYLLQQGVPIGMLGSNGSITALPRGNPFQDGSGLIHIADLSQQSLDMLSVPALLRSLPQLSDGGGRGFADARCAPLLLHTHGLATRASDTMAISALSEQGLGPHLSGSDTMLIRRSLTSPLNRDGGTPAPAAASAAASAPQGMPAPRSSAGSDRHCPEASEPTPAVSDRLDLAKLPTTIPIFTTNNEVTGTLHLHEYVTGTLTRPNRPPACVTLPGSDSPVTPRVAEAKAGREARKNWKESFRTTLPDGRIISIKSFFAMHNIN